MRKALPPPGPLRESVLNRDRRIGLLCAFGAAFGWALFSPVGKWLVTDLPALQVSGVAYLFSGLTLLLLRGAGRGEQMGGGVRREDLGWLALSVLLGGIAGPVLLLMGLARIEAWEGSLLLNLEAVFTVAAGLILLRERPGWRALAGAAGIVAASAAISRGANSGGEGGGASDSFAGLLLVTAACMAWALDNTVSRRLSVRDPRVIGMIKGLVAGSTSLALALPGGLVPPNGLQWAALAVCGGLALGVSLGLYLLSLRLLGVATTGALFALSTPLGFFFSILLLGERPGPVGVGALLLAFLAALLVALDRPGALPPPAGPAPR